MIRRFCRNSRTRVCSAALAIAGPLCFGAEMWIGGQSNPAAGVNTNTFIPFLVDPSFGSTSIRYQQVFASGPSTQFTNLTAELIYISSLLFHMDDKQVGVAEWTNSSLQISFSTTPRTPDNLSTTFAENVGPDNTVVLGPKAFVFSNLATSHNFFVPFDRPFRYDPSAGDLLMDVRVTGIQNRLGPKMEVERSPTDETSRVWATNVFAAVAEGRDTDGLLTAFLFTGLPALTISTNTFGSPTNWIVVRWSDPTSAFRLQKSTTIGIESNWHLIADAKPPGYVMPVASVTNSIFFRLMWPEGP